MRAECVVFLDKNKYMPRRMCGVNLKERKILTLILVN